MRKPRAVVFDVDFTLIYPGPRFCGDGYRDFCVRYGLDVDPLRFEHAVASAAPLLDSPDENAYNAEIFVAYTRHIVEEMGGRGADDALLDACAQEIYAEWARCHHFELYDDVAPVLKQLAAQEIRVALISNSHRCLASFQSHFELEGLIAAALSSSEHGMMKPHPSIFHATLKLIGVAPADAVMVGDSIRQDIDGALNVGMRAIFLDRARRVPSRAADLDARRVPVIGSLRELTPLLLG
jgi:putative hydrolase of the HAD superfamily